MILLISLITSFDKTKKHLMWPVFLFETKLIMFPETNSTKLHVNERYDFLETLPVYNLDVFHVVYMRLGAHIAKRTFTFNHHYL